MADDQLSFLWETMSFVGGSIVTAVLLIVLTSPANPFPCPSEGDALVETAYKVRRFAGRCIHLIDEKASRTDERAQEVKYVSMSDEPWM
jgi:hypothetical protein